MMLIVLVSLSSLVAILYQATALVVRAVREPSVGAVLENLLPFVPFICRNRLITPFYAILPEIYKCTLPKTSAPSLIPDLMMPPLKPVSRYGPP